MQALDQKTFSLPSLALLILFIHPWCFLLQENPRHAEDGELSASLPSHAWIVVPP